MRVITDGAHAPVHLFSTVATDETLRQLRAIASQPYIYGFVAAMADAHLSSGVAVGTVFATESALVPDALGDDLGCGVRASRTSLAASALGPQQLERVLSTLSRRVPAGDRGRSAPFEDESLVDRASAARPALSTRELERRWPTLVARHLATLGGGNHFIELARSPDDELWLLVHSGSRGVGGAIAEHHQRAARAAHRRPLSALELASDAGAAFFADLAVAQRFAERNRSALARLALECVSEALSTETHEIESIDVPHNTVAREEHDGRSLLVHRKGAVRAAEGDSVVVPGSMATATYLAEGLGHEPAWRSCSHGAGRVMSRREARERVRPEALCAKMGRVVFDRRRARDLVEEAPQVYRDVREVLDEQRALVRPTLRLEPVLSFKG
ncbi:MAG: RtcB family protein [Myxococcales bacterium]|nr:RtcB family protein [Myxococcales bacterium]